MTFISFRENRSRPAGLKSALSNISEKAGSGKTESGKAESSNTEPANAELLKD